MANRAVRFFRHRSSAVELSIRNRVVVGSIPTGGSGKAVVEEGGGWWRLAEENRDKMLRTISNWYGFPQPLKPASPLWLPPMKNCTRGESVMNWHSASIRSRRHFLLMNVMASLRSSAALHSPLPSTL